MNTPSVETMKKMWADETARGVTALSFKAWMRSWAERNDGDPITYAYAAAKWLERKAA